MVATLQWIACVRQHDRWYEFQTRVDVTAGQLRDRIAFETGHCGQRFNRLIINNILLDAAHDARELRGWVLPARLARNHLTQVDVLGSAEEYCVTVKVWPPVVGSVASSEGSTDEGESTA
ncbi:hypothetical protein JCM10207_000886 [Rhodosporidiobolus poonsookiae]